MNILILVEDQQYQKLASELATNSQVNVEVSNTDFNLQPSIGKSQIIIFFGPGDVYQLFVNQYHELLTSKLVVHTNQVDCQLPLAVELTIVSKVGVCLIPRLSPEIGVVISESLYNLFDQSLKLLICDEANYQLMLNRIEAVNKQLQAISIEFENQLDEQIVEQLFCNFFVN